MGSEGHVCPSCGQPVETVVRRHKTLGAWVPRWMAGPCHNPACAACDEQGAVRRTGEDAGRAEAAPPAGAPPRL
ncbi:hypothetical protein ACFY78_00315 [Streptomyces olindensis]|uniref:hypothetical protein n=1 Tax=Streptomyces olindensis TaxID=358823 RepID=UPI0036911B02